MYTCNARIKTISKQVRRLFNNLEIRTNHYIDSLLDTKREVITLQIFNNKVLSFPEVKQLDHVYKDYTDIVNCQIDETVNEYNFETPQIVNDRVEQFKTLCNNKINEFINSKYAEYLDLKSYKDFNISKQQKKELEQLAEKYNTYDIDKLKKKIEKEKEKDNSIADLVVSVGALSFLNNLNKKNNYLNNKSKTVVSLSGKRKYNIGSYMSFAFTDMIGQDLADNRQEIYKLNNVKYVFWDNSINNVYCPKCGKYWYVIYNDLLMTTKPKLHPYCYCYLRPIMDKQSYEYFSKKREQQKAIAKSSGGKIPSNKFMYLSEQEIQELKNLK